MDDYKQNHVASRKHLSYQHYIKTVATSMLWRGSDQTFTTYEMSVNTNQVTHSHSFSFVHIHSHSLTFTHSHSLPPSLPHTPSLTPQRKKNYESLMRRLPASFPNFNLFNLFGLQI